MIDTWDEGWFPPRGLGGIFGPPPPTGLPPPQGVSWRAKIYKSGTLSLPLSFSVDADPGYVREVGLALSISFASDVIAQVANQDAILALDFKMGGVPPDVVTGGLSLFPGFRGVASTPVIDTDTSGLSLSLDMGGDGVWFKRGFPYEFSFSLAEGGTSEDLPLPADWEDEESMTAVRANDIATIVNSLGDGSLPIPRSIFSTADASLTLTTAYNLFVFTGTAPSTWTLPPVAGNTGAHIHVANRGTSPVTINRVGTDLIYQGFTSESITVPIGTTLELTADNLHWLVVNKQ